MFRAYFLYLIVGLVLIGGCSSGSEDSPPVAASQDVLADSWRESRLLEGRKTYQAVCASCHDPGAGKAPDIGDRAAWSDRSDLWSAVLSQHATAGFLEMPEKGGHGELTEDAVAAATEYMLLETFPERPRD